MAGKHVLILGAGASKGSNLQSAPPIIRDFFSAGAKLAACDHSKLWELLASLQINYRSTSRGDTNIENVFQLLETLDAELIFKNSETLRVELGVDIWSLTPTSLLELFIIDVLFVASKEAIELACKYHNELFSSLNPGDAVISFNYDLIADASLRWTGRWNEFEGYHVSCGSRASVKIGIDLDSFISDGYDLHSQYTLLKPHGSLNWKAVNFTDKWGEQNELAIIPLDQYRKMDNPVLSSLRYEAFRDGDGGLERIFHDDPEGLDFARHQERMKKQDAALLVPPAKSKIPSRDICNDLKHIWRAVEQNLIEAHELTIVGYSFGRDENFFRSLFGRCLSRNSLHQIPCTVVDPTDEPVRNISSLSTKLDVRHFKGTLGQFVE